ncbi:CDP-glycerol glycerophosphotransferase family protein [Tepidibacter formicigenes]|jgi:CDP-glycerol glycerophosphotransferase (TagB/SpsB family)|uniref:CDP-ribitol ribitolphosphotransferase n=1 Tax=Tepidibacter formicigenes DSM 15518 TaxID=1123349 RepID=A0A1M6QDU3_9FIRM|nr:CDP-glycerol glycerophosphotransferase family protein [Tepidibacter formicigenes]SHK18247.1 CDP-ribitol ribitolphosphotransferase [Tepidibacter formicigenes DSM 15518]
MKKTIFIYDYMQNGEVLYNYIKKNDHYNLLKNNKVVYIPFRINKSFSDKIKRVFEIGLINIVRNLITKNSIIVSTAPSRFQSYISKNIICMNHGWATKKTPGNNELNDNNKMKDYKLFKKSCKYIICLSDFDSTYYLKGGNLDKIDSPIFLPLGIPRNDYLLQNKNNINLIHEISSKLGINRMSKKVFFYAPTHRETKENNEEMLKRILEEFEGLDNKLGLSNSILIFRPHYFSKGIKKHIDKFKNIYYAGYDEYPDTRDLMIFSDILITDYSSIFVDYLLLNKPIIFYTFDLPIYQEMRGLVIDYNNNIQTPGPKIRSLQDIVKIEDSKLKEYNLIEAKKFFHKNYDENSSKRIYEFLVSITNNDT